MKSIAVRHALRRRPGGWTLARIAAAVVLALILVAGLAADPLQHWLGLRGPGVHDPTAVNLFGDPTGPGSIHPLGVDGQGRDVLSRILYGLRSMVLLSLAGAGLGLLAAQALDPLARRRRGLGLVIHEVLSALAAFPPVLLGLGLAMTLGSGSWRLIVILALSQLGLAAADRRALPAVALRALAGAMSLDFALTFLGDVPGGGPQLGAMVRQAGEGIVAGVPQWWALLFPGLVLWVTLAAVRVVLPPRALVSRLDSPPRWPTFPPRAWVAGQLAGTATRLIVVAGLAALMLESVGGADRAGTGGAGRGALSGVGPALSASASLLGGAAVVWLLASAGQLVITTRPRRLARLANSAGQAERVPGPISGRRRLSRLLPARRRLARPPVGRAGAALLSAALVSVAPLGWLGFLALFLFSDSVGKLALLPGAGSYVGLSHDPGRWAQALIMPWLLLGLSAAAGLSPEISATVAERRSAGQQRVARAAGVSERRLAGQLRRAVLARLPVHAGAALNGFFGRAVLLEVAFAIPGAGRLTVLDFHAGAAATVSDLATLAAGAVVLASLAAALLRVGLDPSLEER